MMGQIPAAQLVTPAKPREDGMSDEPKKRSRAWIGWTLIAGLVLYPLSIGPVLFICGFFSLDEPTALGIVYAPLIPLDRELQPYHQAWRDYGALAHKSLSR
jgi:hypothetical protein